MQRTLTEPSFVGRNDPGDELGRVLAEGSSSSVPDAR
jgi:hypothetical protein